MKRANASLLGIVAPQGEERTYCLLASKEVSQSTCEATQGQEGCFGCASIFRRCESCKLRLVAVPAVGLCSSCLIEALKREETKSTAVIPQRVHCQIVGKEIRVSMCEATQGQESCRGCTAISRKCETCKKRGVHFQRYGLCLHCTVEELGDGWQPSLVSEEERSPMKPQSPRLTITPASSVQRPAVPGAIELNGRNVADYMGMSEPEGEALVGSMKQLGVIRDGNTVSKNEQTEHLRPPLLQRVCDEIMNGQVASPNNLAHLLKISEHAAEQILSVLEEIKVLSPVTSHKTRRRLVDRQRGRQLINMYLMRAARKMKATHTRGDKVISGKEQPLGSDIAYSKVRAFVLEARTSSRNTVCRELKLSRHVVNMALERLELEGILGPPPGPRDPRPILVKDGRRPPSIRGKAASPSQKIQKLQQLIRTVGEDTPVGQILRSVIEDVEELKRLKYNLHQITRKR